jgi:hypothetical protein
MQKAGVYHAAVDRHVAAIVNERATDWSNLQARAARGSLKKLHRVLAKLSNAPQKAMDRL